MNIVFCPNITGEIKVRRSGSYVMFCLTGQHGDTFAFVFDDDTAEHLIHELFFTTYDEKVPDDIDDGAEMEPWSALLDDVPF